MFPPSFVLVRKGEIGNCLCTQPSAASILTIEAVTVCERGVSHGRQHPKRIVVTADNSFRGVHLKQGTDESILITAHEVWETKYSHLTDAVAFLNT